MAITFPTNTAEIIDKIRAVIGRSVTFRTVTYSGCSVCALNVVSNTSVDSFCPTCEGLYWIPQVTPIAVTGHITWKPSDIVNWYPGGRQFDGDCLVQIKYTPSHKQMVELTEDMIVDGKVVEIKSETLLGAPELNRILLNCIEKEKSA